MANLIAGGMKTLGEYNDVPGATGAKLLEAWNRTENAKLFHMKTVQRVICVNADSVDKTQFTDLNIRDLQSVKGKHLIDIVEFSEPLDTKAIVTKLQQNQYDQLPEPLNAKSDMNDIGYTMSVNMKKVDENKY